MNGVATGTTAPACARLARELRELRARTGLSMAALARRTAYSKSSWERYLNGKALPPRRAVETLCAVAGEPPGRLVALWELADLEWSGRARSTGRRGAGGTVEPSDGDRPGGGSRGGGTSTDRAGPGPEGVGHRARRWKLALVAGVSAVGVTVGAVVWLTASPGAEPGGRASDTASAAPGCRGPGCEGRDPAFMGCGLPGQVRSLGPPHRTSTGARLEIRYSTECDAAWARVWDSRVGDSLEVSIPGSRPHRAEVADRYDAEGYLFTPMVNGRGLPGLRVCFEPAGGGERECFAR
ncbi:hypothetical protein AQ490_22065 [Wenjunlia vitaminophila]|uniref:HTH cro/C1-type domain-containing protein n=1 Tax=Wenjunlia vitaminophila TaxID=76728 RepID=A0A0T6LT74_WENVI|nr:XRE family transcriptional regulator [Wenjunlia vitaminophila]KRV49004.1 hypothetical protein AQ490_22065 [Wenjunlia vitaminophila]